MPKPKEYHLIELYTGISHGAFVDLAGARKYARDENFAGWDIFKGNTRIEKHDPLSPDPPRRADAADLRLEGHRCTALADRTVEPRLRSQIAAMAINYFHLACEVERAYGMLDSGPEPEPEPT
jgi:hypothetical protein